MDLDFGILRAQPLVNAAAPTLNFRLEIRASAPVHAILLRTQIQIEPRRRSHDAGEQAGLGDLFGAPERWSESVRPLVWSLASVNVGAFDDRLEVDLPVACTYDFEVAAAKYLAALKDGQIPLRFLFSGTVFARAASGFAIQQIPWSKDAVYRMPLAVWRDLMNAYFPGEAWIRARHETLQALQRFRAANGMTSWDEAIEALLE